jgi:hypothetical protein
MDHKLNKQLILLMKPIHVFCAENNIEHLSLSIFPDCMGAFDVSGIGDEIVTGEKIDIFEEMN